MKLLKNLILIYFKFYLINLFIYNINANVNNSNDLNFFNENQIWPNFNKLNKKSVQINEVNLIDNNVNKVILIYLKKILIIYLLKNINYYYKIYKYYKTMLKNNVFFNFLEFKYNKININYS